MLEACSSCSGHFEPIEGGPTHKYMLSTPGCWAAFGTVLEREYSDPELFASSHRLTVDAYALQHPGDPNDSRAIQSVWLHAVSLHLVLHQGAPHREATRALQRLAGRSFDSLPTPPSAFAVTHADVVAAPVDEHEVKVSEWAECALEAWDELHGPIAALASTLAD